MTGPLGVEGDAKSGHGGAAILSYGRDAPKAGALSLRRSSPAVSAPYAIRRNCNARTNFRTLCVCSIGAAKAGDPVVAAPAQANFSGDFPSQGSDPLAGTAAGTQTSPMGASRPQSPNAVNYTAPGAADSAGAASGPSAGAALPASSRGIYGLKDLKLMVASSKTNTETTVITSTGKDVHLDSGVRLLLVMTAEAPAAPAR